MCSAPIRGFHGAGGETGGVLTADDARRALSVGADVLVVPNQATGTWAGPRCP